MIETAKANGLVVEKYLVYLFDKLSGNDTENKELLLDLMTWNNCS
ncbi:transposase domain-containing protein [Clostridium cellulovorans]